MADYTWQVTGQTQETAFDTQGNQVEGKRIQFTVSPSGYVGTVFIPDTLYANVDAVRERIAAEAAMVSAIHGMTG